MANIDKMMNFLSTVSKTKDDIESIKKDGNSIKARTKGLILQYPVLVSQAVQPESASAIMRSLEHEYANLMTLIIQDEAIAGKNVQTTSTFLGQFHKNINESATVTPEDIKIVNESMMLETDINLYNEDSLNDHTVDVEILRSFNEDANDIAKELSVKGGNKEKNVVNKADIMNTKDIKKLNDVQPTIIRGNVNYRVDGNVVEKNINFGVKCVMHGVESGELVNNLILKVGSPSLIMKFIEWTTGEKRLLTDIVLEKNTMKSLAKTKSSANYWFRRLEKISNSAENSKTFNKFISHIPFGKKLMDGLNLGKNIPMPVTSLVISKSEVDQITASAGIDLLKDAGMVNEIMRRYYLLSFVIIDDVVGTVYFFNEVSNRFAQYSLKQVQGFAKDNLMTPEEALKKSLMR